MAGLAIFAAGCAAATSGGTARPAGTVEPGRAIQERLERAIGLLERYECATFAVEFLSPIKRSQIEDLDAYRQARACSPDDRGNLDDVLLALRLALGAQPEIHGVRAVIDLSGIGTRITQFELMRYIDGRWYFNSL